jgi:bifunctional non-homologous end joining protein LigD
VALKTYRAKRKFDVTSEPRGKIAETDGNRFVIQKHAARRLHYDFRLELDGVMKSWAVTRGPSLVPGEKRLAVHVEDHPIEYNTFEGTIPKGEYGGGTVMIWDRGRWYPEGNPDKGYRAGRLNFRLEGEKLHGNWHLVRMRKREGERQDPWLLIKSNDADARGASAPDILEEEPWSVASKRSMDEITEGAPARKRRPAAKKAASKATIKATPKTAAKRVSKTAKPAPRKGKRAPSRTRAAIATSDVRRAEPRRRGRKAPPDFVAPCLARLEAQAPSGSGWVHEIKFDGYRIEARLNDGEVELKTRTGLDWTGKFQPIADAVAKLRATNAIIDGEIVVDVGNGISDFSTLQADLSSGRTDRFAYYVFDLLFLDGEDVSKRPLIERKAALAELVGKKRDGRVRLSEDFAEPGPSVLKHACQLGLEGIISKHSDAPYRSGRTGDWLKIKCSDRQEFVVTGYKNSTVGPGLIGALALGYYQDGALRYAGRVGTGFTQKTSRELYRRLQPLRQDKPPFAARLETSQRRGMFWVKPELVAEIDSRGFTADQILRHPSFKGLREDKAAREVVRETPAHAAAQEDAMAKTIAQRKAKPAAARKRASSTARRTITKRATTKQSDDEVQLTHPDRVYWTDAGITKQDLADYYRDVWDWIAPHVVRRLLSLLRCPDGASGQCFFQKHAHATFNQGHILRVRDGKEEIIAIEGLEGLIALAQAGVLEVHVWGSTIDSIDACDRLIFDLDPGPGVAWPDVIAATRELRARLAKMKLESFVKTTGGKGFHVVVPIAGTDWDTAKDFSHQVALAMEKDAPDRYISKMTKSKREGRIFIDYLRNGRGATAVVAYSTRARPGAPVSTPIDWSELSPKLKADKFNLENVRTRLARLKQDPWKDIGKIKQKLPG